MISTLNDIKRGLIINYQNEPWQVMEAHFMRTSQRKPVMQTKLKSLLTEKTLEVSFKPSDKVETADITKKQAQFLYADQENAHFMDQESYEQFAIKSNVIEKKLTFLKEGESIEALFWQNQPLTINLPKKVDLKVIAAPPGIKGDSAQGRVTKQITLENQLTINAPLFIKEGDIVRINTETGEYVERVS